MRRASDTFGDAETSSVVFVEDMLKSSQRALLYNALKTDQARSGEALRHMLHEQNRRYVFALVQKYRDQVSAPYSERADIVVISDEAHRTQYGRMALNMRGGGMVRVNLASAGNVLEVAPVFSMYQSLYVMVSGASTMSINTGTVEW